MEKIIMKETNSTDLLNITVDEKGRTRVIYKGTELFCTSVEFEANATDRPTLNCEIVIAPDIEKMMYEQLTK